MGMIHWLWIGAIFISLLVTYQYVPRHWDLRCAKLRRQDYEQCRANLDKQYVEAVTFYKEKCLLRYRDKVKELREQTGPKAGVRAKRIAAIRKDIQNGLDALAIDHARKQRALDIRYTKRLHLSR